MDEDREAALDAARLLVTQYLGQQPHIMKASGVPESLLDEIGKVLTWPATHDDVVTASKLVPDDVVQLITASGTPDECRAKVAEYVATGCTCPGAVPTRGRCRGDDRRVRGMEAMSVGPTMLSNTDPALRRAWHVVAQSAEIGVDPVAVRLLGEQWALVRLPDADGTRLVAFADRCPHRLAPLSAGRVVGDALQCGYHGWCFDADGACTDIPAIGGSGHIPPRARATTPAALTERAGLVFLAPEPPVTELLDLTVAQDDSFVHGVLHTTRARVGAGLMVDNFLDQAHFPFVHAATIGTDDALEVPDVTIVRDGFGMSVDEPPAVPQPRGPRRAATDPSVAADPGAAVRVPRTVRGDPAHAVRRRRARPTSSTSSSNPRTTTRVASTPSSIATTWATPPTRWPTASPTNRRSSTRTSSSRSATRISGCRSTSPSRSTPAPTAPASRCGASSPTSSPPRRR